MKKNLLAASLAAALSLGSNLAQAGAVITFDQDGLGGGSSAVQMSSLDWVVNSAVSVGAVPLSPGSTFTILLHASLGNIIDQNGDAINVASGHEITFVAGFKELTISANPFPGTASFVSIAGGVNFFEVYYDAVKNSNGLTGTGYNDGQLILSGFVNAGGTSNFAVTDVNGGALDQFTNNDFPGTTSVKGIGSSKLITTVTFFDPNFFQNLMVGAVMSVDTDTDLNNPHTKANPSKCFTNAAGGNAVSSCDAIANNVDPTAYNPTPGAVNGISGPDFYLQSDASSSFLIPEPGSLALLGLSLSALGFARRRTSKA